MKSWSNWCELNKDNIDTMPDEVKGIYIIRTREIVQDAKSDIIYIGSSGTGKRGLKGRLNFLCRAIKTNNKKKASAKHSAANKIKPYRRYGLEFSWVSCNNASEGVEKAFLLAFYTSTGNLPICNKRF